MPLIEGADAVIGCFGTQDYPTNVLWRLGAIRERYVAAYELITGRSFSDWPGVRAP